MSTPAETLQQARDLIADPKHWTTRSSARNATARPVPVYGSEATSFCTLGAIDRVIGPGDPSDFYAATEFIYQVIGSAESIAQYNDSHTHEQVLAVWDLAIATEAMS